MKTSIHTMIVSSFLLSLLAGGLSACPTFAEDNGIDFWNMGIYHRQIKLCEEERGRLQIENEETFRRLILKEEIVRELLDGRISATEAGERFAEVNRTLPSQAAYLMQYQGKTDLERASRQLISFLRAGRGEQARKVATTIERSL